jgi:hypothetical protein
VSGFKYFWKIIFFYGIRNSSLMIKEKKYKKIALQFAWNCRKILCEKFVLFVTGDLIYW